MNTKEENELQIQKYLDEYLTLVKPNDPNVIYHLADYYFENKNYELMFKYATMGDKLGYRDSINLLGIYYKSQKNIELTIQYFLKAIQLGSPVSMCNLAFIYYKQKNYKLSLKYYLMAINHNHKTALNGFCSIKEISWYKKYTILKKFKDNDCIEKCNEIIKQYPQIQFIKNKINLFAKFNNVHSCVICLEENVLNVCFDCAHEVCVNCFLKSQTKCYYNCTQSNNHVEGVIYLPDDDNIMLNENNELIETDENNTVTQVKGEEVSELKEEN